MTKLLIVESPAKAKTIEKYLGKGFKVMATMGHIIDLPKNKLAVDVENGYKPEWTTIRGKGTVIKKLKKAAKDVDEVILAMDPDREGEAIAWHTANALKLDNPKRVVYHEIVKDAILQALENPRAIDMNLVDAQISRRVLDRLVGYQLSQLLWKKIWYGLSAGRVQSPALRLIVEREEEINNFKPKEFWSIIADVIEKDGKKDVLPLHLVKKDNKKFIPSNQDEVDQVEKDIKDVDFVVTKVSQKNIKRHAYPPFTTSTMQQTANTVLGFGAKRTMGIAQILYQNGFITYMRTDSVFMSQKAVKEIRKLIRDKYGSTYLPKKPNVYKKKAKLAQEAHEAIRPVHFNVTPEEIEQKFGKSEAKLYRLIYNRAVASQMTEKVSKRSSVEMITNCNDTSYTWSVSFESLVFDGFTKVLGSSKKAEDVLQIPLDTIKQGDIFLLKKLHKEQKFTKPKARYTEASLIKTLEKYGIGRPSTYATIISTLIDRGYIVKESKSLKPQDIGIVVANFLKQSFMRLVDYDYTAKVEDDLDQIATGKLRYEPFVDRENKLLLREIEQADKSISKEDVVILGDSDEKCPKCGGKMVIRIGRYGKFLSCANFPKCKGMKSLDEGEGALDFDKYLKPKKCPKCGGSMVLKIGKYGRFWACENYPNCKGTLPLLLNEKCPECGHNLVERRGKWGKTFIGCSNYPKCKYIKKSK